ncbi:DoxX family protein [Plantactinospora sp. CA-290183]|uniref:DoxX family protein n=1 Tax=Plantactinospora sp. CA-290183 TaxID=3240006 RepID=UPI003D91514E
MRPVRTVARTLLSTIFVVGGARALANPEHHVERARRVTDRVGPLLAGVHSGIPQDPATLVRVNAAAQLVGGLLLATGHCTRPAAAVLAGTLLPTTAAGHPFWTVEDPAQRTNQQVHFMKNLGLLGGLLLAAADTEGRPGLRWRTGRAMDDSRRTVRRAVRSARRDARIAVRSAATARRLPG